MARRRTHPTRSPALRFAALVAVLAVAVTGWLAARGLAAKRHLDAARGDIAAARQALLDRRVPAARAAIEAASLETRKARRLTADPVWDLAAAVPIAGATMRTTQGLTVAADDVASLVLPELVTAAAQLAPESVRLPDGTFDLARIHRASAPVSNAYDQVADVRHALDALPRSRIAQPVAAAQVALTTQVVDLQRLLRESDLALRIAPALLGEDRPRRYLVIPQQTSESRGTGGLPGGFTTLLVDKGRVNVVVAGSNAGLRSGPIPVPPDVPTDYVERYAPIGAFDLWANVNLSPNLPMVARVVEARWRAQGGRDLDGIVLLDAVALSQILSGNPGIQLGSGNVVAPAALPEYLAVGQYAGPDDESQRQRKDELGDAARATAERVAAGSGSREALLRGLIRAVHGGHLRMASDDPVLRAGLAEAGVDGALPPGLAPVAYAVVVNGAGGKLDYFLDRSVVYDASPCQGGQRASSIVVELTNNAPATGLPPYVTRLQKGTRITHSTDNLVLLNVYGTRGATLVAATMDGAPIEVANGGPKQYLSYDEEAGLPVWETTVALPRGQTRRLLLQLLEPATPGAARVPEQPLARAQETSVSVPECRAATGRRD